MTASYTPDRTQRHEFANGAVGFPPAVHTGKLKGPFAAVYFCPVQGTALVLTCYGKGEAMRHLDGVSVPACTKHRRQHITGALKTDSLGNVSFIPSPSHLSRLKD